MRKATTTLMVGAVAVVGLFAGASAAAQGPRNAGARSTIHADVDARNAGRVNVRPDAQQAAEIRALAPAAVQWNPGQGAPASIVKPRGYLTSASAKGAGQVARDFLKAHRRLYGLSDAEIGSLATKSDYRTDHNGVTQLALGQQDEGRDVFGAIAAFVVDRSGRLVAQNGVLDPDPHAEAPATLSAGEAVRAAADAVSATAAGPLTLRSTTAGPAQRTTFDNPYAPTLANPRAIRAELVTFPMPAGQAARVAWKIAIEVADAEDYETVVDARSGGLLYRRNGYRNAAPEGNVYTTQNPIPLSGQGFTSFLGIDGSWVAGDTTQGNNTNTYEDRDANNASDYQQHTPASPNPNFQRFTAAFTNAYETGPNAGTTAGLDADRDAVAAQLFYWVNFTHDYLYNLGFNEVARNFQADNFGRGGAQNDAVQAEIYNGWGDNTGTQKLCPDGDPPVPNSKLCRNNANFNTPADGAAPRLQVYVGATPLPNRLSEMEGDTVIHEYVHGLSNRLVGGGSMGGGAQTDGMGEGWGDFYTTSIFNDPVIFEYSGQANASGGVSGFRSVRYDTSTLTYTDVCNPGCEEHDDGEVWATVLWAMRARLITKLGSLAAGKARAEQLVIDGMKNTGRDATFLMARDAILAADVTNYAGADTCLIWGVFAARKMGVSAATAADQKSVTAATDGPLTCQPAANAGGPYTTPEGPDATLSAAASTTPTGTGPLTYQWDFDNDGAYDDATGVSPAFTNVGRDTTAPLPIGLKVTNADGFTSTASTTLSVTNVAPVVGTITTNSPRTENSTVTVSGAVTDAGWEDPLSATINWGDASATQALTGDEEHERPDGTLAYDIAHVYGDDGVFTVTVCASDDDVAAPVCRTTPVTVTNVNPTATINKSGATDVNGTPVLIAHTGQPVAFSGRATDPGSDDLTLRWNWGDGLPLIDATSTYLVNGPATDPDPSPSVQPRDVSDSASHAFGQACTYDIVFSASDDDGGSASATIKVLITGTKDAGRPSGYWAHQYRQRGAIDIDSVTLGCYLEITAFVSKVFNEVRDVATFQKAQTLLFSSGKSVTKRDQLERDLLTAWLNFANGAVGWSELVDTNADGVADTQFHVAMQTAESVRLSPAPTPAQLDAQRAKLQSINDTA